MLGVPGLLAIDVSFKKIGSVRLHSRRHAPMLENYLKTIAGYGCLSNQERLAFSP